MELIKQYKFSSEQMRELYAHTHTVNEQTRLMEEFIKNQEGKSNTAQEATATLYLLANSISNLQGHLLGMKAQVEKWDNALEKASEQAVPAKAEKPQVATIRDFFNGDKARMTKFQNYRNFPAKKYGLDIKPLGKVPGGRALLFRTSDFEAYVAKVEGAK